MRYTINEINNMSMYELHKVVLLDLSFMDLNIIPSKIFQMENLEYLNISNNLITEIPKKIKKLISLKTLYAKNNPIATIHQNLLGLQKLKEMYFDQDCIIDSIMAWSNSVTLSEENELDVDNLSSEVEHLIINSYNYELINLPINLKCVHLIETNESNLKVPLNCRIINWL